MKFSLIYFVLNEQMEDSTKKFAIVLSQDAVLHSLCIPKKCKENEKTKLVDLSRTYNAVFSLVSGGDTSGKKYEI